MSSTRCTSTRPDSERHLAARARRLLAALTVLAVAGSSPATFAQQITTGPNSPGATFNDVTFGTVAWTTPGNAGASDDTYAQASPGGGSTNYLHANNFNLQIPPPAVIEGIEVNVEKRSLSGTVLDSRVRIVKGGVVGATERADGAAWPTVDTIVTYGGTSDLWGETWTAADLNANDFGVVISATDGLDTAAIDHVTMTVHFSLCGAAPQVGCRTSAKSVLLVKDIGDDTKDKIVWKLTNGDPTSQTDFADPTATALYAFCVYEAGALTADAVIAPSASLWATVSTKGFKYKDNAGTQSSIIKALLKGSADPKVKVLLKGKGASVPAPPPPLALPVVVQLVNSDNGICWEATYSTFLKNQAGLFKAKF
jgi:hypothetical protein